MFVIFLNFGWFPWGEERCEASRGIWMHLVLLFRRMGCVDIYETFVLHLLQIYLGAIFSGISGWMIIKIVYGSTRFSHFSSMIICFCSVFSYFLCSRFFTCNAPFEIWATTAYNPWYYNAATGTAPSFEVFNGLSFRANQWVAGWLLTTATLNHTQPLNSYIGITCANPGVEPRIWTELNRPLNRLSHPGS